MFSINIHADSIDDLKEQLAKMHNAFNNDLAAEETDRAITETAVIEEPIKPVLTQAQMEENVEKAPVHELPPIPPIEEVRAALNALKDMKGIAAVKALLKEYGANSVPELKPECYLQIRDRASAEAGVA